MVAVVSISRGLGIERNTVLSASLHSRDAFGGVTSERDLLACCQDIVATSFGITVLHRITRTPP
jgi:hypothetical protein